MAGGNLTYDGWVSDRAGHFIAKKAKMPASVATMDCKLGYRFAYSPVLHWIPYVQFGFRHLRVKVPYTSKIGDVEINGYPETYHSPFYSLGAKLNWKIDSTLVVSSHLAVGKIGRASAEIYRGTGVCLTSELCTCMTVRENYHCVAECIGKQG